MYCDGAGFGCADGGVGWLGCLSFKLMFRNDESRDGGCGDGIGGRGGLGGGAVDAARRFSVSSCAMRESRSAVLLLTKTLTLR